MNQKISSTCGNGKYSTSQLKIWDKLSTKFTTNSKNKIQYFFTKNKNFFFGKFYLFLFYLFILKTFVLENFRFVFLKILSFFSCKFYLFFLKILIDCEIINDLLNFQLIGKISIIGKFWNIWGIYSFHFHFIFFINF